jgi:hypothetical protein
MNTNPQEGGHDVATRWVTTRENDMEPVTRKQPMFQPVGGVGPARFDAQIVRDEELFERAWFVDFRKQWQLDLQAHRDMFRARLEAI